MRLDMDMGISMGLVFGGSFLVTVLGMKGFIWLLGNTGFLKREKRVEGIKKSCIRELHKDKVNTFTMGGVVMNLVFLMMTGVYYFVSGNFMGISIFIVLFGIMGFIDDFIKIKRIRDGVSVKGKLIGLTVISVGVVLFLNYVGAIDYSVVVPLIGRGFKLNGMIYFILMVGLLVFSTNSMNITDGLDGLALGISIIVLAFIVLVAYQKVNLEVMHGGLILLGTCLGALIYNKFPAKIFIGDTGSLFLGGAIAIFLIKLQMPLWIPIVLIVCLWESFTVVIQLFSLRLRGKKVFKIEPYHHHLEKSGWEETKIVYWFWLITGLFCTIGYLAL